MVDVEHLNGHYPGFRFADEDRLIPMEVAMPVLLSRIEERIEFAREHSG